MPERPEEMINRMINDLCDDLDVGRSGSERRRQWARNQQRFEEQIKRQDAVKDRRTAAFAGIGYGIIGTAVTGVLSFATGLAPWLLNLFTPRR